MKVRKERSGHLQHHTGIWILFSAELYLKALRADFLPLLHPGDAGFGVTYCLAYKRCHSSGNPCLIIRGLDEAGHAYQREVRRLKTQVETT